MYAWEAEPQTGGYGRGPMRFSIVPITEVPGIREKAEVYPERPVVLVVNYDSAVADEVVEVLSGNGYAAIASYDAEDALETAVLMPPDLIITDVGLPGMSGFAVATALKSELSDCKLILISGPDRDDGLLDLGTKGQDEFVLVNKPIDRTELLRQVAASLKTR